MPPFIINQTAKGIPYNAFTQKPLEYSYLKYDELQEAIVVDVIVNEQHPEYAKTDGYNIGAIKFRLIKTHAYRSDDTLNWALPIEANITDYPLLNEIVTIHSCLNRSYYFRKINTTNTNTVQPILGLKEELDEPETVVSKQKLRDQSKNSAIRQKPAITSLFGKYFTDLQIAKLRSDEGDIIYEGRSGQSIRFGSSWTPNINSLYKTNFKSNTTDQSANIIISVRGKDQQKNKTDFVSLIAEDINADNSSIWITADQSVDLRVSTENSKSNKKSISDYPTLTGAQIIENSDRILLNARKDKLLGHAYTGIHWTSGKNFTIDTDVDYLSWIGSNYISTVNGLVEWNVNSRFSIICDKIYLGTRNTETQPVPLGTLLANFLQAFIDAHLQNAPMHIITPVGPGILDPSVVIALTKLKIDVAKGKFSSFNSKNIFAK
jgi:hypothetical protein